MQWTDQAVVIGHHVLSEKNLRLEIFCKQYGRQFGFFSPSATGVEVIHIGDVIQCSWGARLDTHLGRLLVEPIQSIAPILFHAPSKLLMLKNCMLLSSMLPQGHPYPGLFEFLKEELLLCLLVESSELMLWSAVCAYEVAVLSELGFGFDIAKCCVSGATQNLVYLSPKTGRAVCKDASGGYQDRLLPLPLLWQTSVQACDESTITQQQILESLYVTEYFLKKWICPEPHCFYNLRAQIKEHLSSRRQRAIC